LSPLWLLPLRRPPTPSHWLRQLPAPCRPKLPMYLKRSSRLDYRPRKAIWQCSPPRDLEPQPSRWDEALRHSAPLQQAYRLLMKQPRSKQLPATL
jgi:hypothetical protein